MIQIHRPLRFLCLGLLCSFFAATEGAAGDMQVIVLAEDFSGRVEQALGNLKAARD